MRKLINRKRNIVILVTTLILGLVIVAAVAVSTQTSISIQTLQEHPSSFHGRTVSICGTVKDCHAKVSQRGNAYYTFSLAEDDHAVTVFSFGKPRVIDGQFVTVRGLYSDVKEIGAWTIPHEIDVTYGRIIPGRTRADCCRQWVSTLFNP